MRLLGVACYVLWSFGLIVFHSEFICQDGIKNKEFGCAYTALTVIMRLSFFEFFRFF